MKLPRHIIESRVCEFPGPLRDLYQNNVVVNKIIDAYAYGSIVTREEALCQMVIALAATADSSVSELVRLHQLNCFATINPKNSTP